MISGCMKRKDEAYAYTFTINLFTIIIIIIIYLFTINRRSILQLVSTGRFTWCVNFTKLFFELNATQS